MDSEGDLFDEIEEGDAQAALQKMDMRGVKTLLNVIRNVIDNPDFKDCILPHHKRILKPYQNTFAKLLDDKVKLTDKRKLLQRDGEEYLPTFLEIIGNQLDDCIPRQENRKRKDCPLCGKKNLVKLSNHLADIHHLSKDCLLYTSPSPRDAHESRMPSSA